uniref:Uncharacterized protein n=1 Tax=Rhizophora mucronata TaxID=61149 RepID=A0A2P2QZ95_RHIMU
MDPVSVDHEILNMSLITSKIDLL